MLPVHILKADRLKNNFPPDDIRCCPSCAILNPLAIISAPSKTCVRAPINLCVLFANRQVLGYLICMKSVSSSVAIDIADCEL